MDNDQVEASRDDYPTRTGVAAGLAVGGVVALVVAWVLGDDFSPAEPGSGWVRVGTVVAVVLLGGVIWLRWRRWRRPGDRAIPRTTLAVCVVAFVIAVLAGWGLVGQYLRGFPGQSALLATLGGLALTAGALLGLRVTGQWRVLPAAGAFLLVPVVATPLVLIAPDLRVDATTAPAAKAATVPGSVSTVAWSTEVDGQVRNVVPAGTGVVLLLADRVMAIDGPTGDVRWTWARHGAMLRGIDVSPDGATVVVHSTPSHVYRTRMEVIDAVTGQVRFTADRDHEGVGGDIFTRLTNTTYIRGTDSESELSGFSLTDNRRLWTYRLPSDCQLFADPSAYFTVSTGLLLPIVCSREVNYQLRYVLVDGTTGTVRWDQPVPGQDPAIELFPDRRFLSVADFQPKRTVVLDTETGAAVPVPQGSTIRSAGLAIAGDQLIDAASGEPLPSTAAFRACMSSNFGVSLTSETLCIDPALESLGGVADTGRIELAAGTPTDEELRRIPVTLGGPFDQSVIGDDPILFVAAPGAVVVTTGMALTANGRAQVVGLR